MRKAQKVDVWFTARKGSCWTQMHLPLHSPVHSVGRTCLRSGTSKAASKLTACSKDQREEWSGPSTGIAYGAQFCFSPKSMPLEVSPLLSANSFEIAKEIPSVGRLPLEGHVWLCPLSLYNGKGLLLSPWPASRDSPGSFLLSAHLLSSPPGKLHPPWPHWPWGMLLNPLPPGP